MNAPRTEPKWWWIFRTSGASCWPKGSDVPARVFGIILDQEAKARPLAEQIIQGNKTLPSTRNIILGHGPATLGWIGNSESNTAEQHGLLAVMDGAVYNRADFGIYQNDAALMLSLYQTHGLKKALALCNGDFALAIYDAKNQALYLARDRFGIKPLYYCHAENRFAFGSQPSLFWDLPWVNRTPDPHYVAVFAAGHYRYIDNRPNKSPYLKINQVPAGTFVQYQTGRLSNQVYYRLVDKPDFTSGEDELSEQYRDLLINAVEIRLNETSKPVFTLSGGMDSSSVLSSAVAATGNIQPAISTVYHDKTYDESDEIQPMLGAKVDPWHPVPVEVNDLHALITGMVDVNDEPVATATWLSHYLLCQQTAKLGYTGLFGGLGGDELNAGEYEYFFFHFADLKTAGRIDDLDREIQCWIQNHDHPIFRKNRSVVDRMFDNIVDFSKPGLCRPESNRLRRYYKALNPDFFNLAGFQPIMEHPFASFLKNRTFQDLSRETAPCCLRAEDRQTLAFGLDNFLPFFDHRLVEFMFRVPGDMKINNGVTKILLRKAMKGILPEETRTRVAKMGWNAPAHLWFSGTGLEYVRDLVAGQRFRQRGIYNVPEVERIIADHQRIVDTGALEENHMMFIWQLVNLTIWLDMIGG
jgi:asparagine synthase (glutamine-hydrolysing)